jgi:hypothetical protein
MKEKNAERLLGLFRSHPDGFKSLTEEKLSACLEIMLANEQRERNWAGYEMPVNDCRGWSMGFIHDPSPEHRYYGAECLTGCSYEDFYVLNRYECFRWDATEFILSLWACDLLLNLKNGVKEVDAVYAELKAKGFQEILEKSDSDVRANFGDPEVLDGFDENAVTDGGYYLYQVLTGQRLSEKTAAAVAKGADVPYLNYFLLEMLGWLGNGADEKTRHDERGWLMVDDPVIRKVLMLICSSFGCMDGGCTTHTVVCSEAIAKYVNKERRKLTPQRRAVMDGMLDVMLCGRSEGEFEGGGLGRKWPHAVNEISRSLGVFVSACAYNESGHPASPWSRHASAAFHLLYDEWCEQSINERKAAGF